MAEYWDIYDQQGDLTNNYQKRGVSLKEGSYHLVVSNWIRNKQGYYLIQKRKKPLSSYFNPWSTTAGAAIKGETSLESIQRETLEEMGLDFTLHEFTFKERAFFNDFIMDVYETYYDGAAEEIKFDPLEVEEVKWVTKTELKEMYFSKVFFDHSTSYLRDILNN